MVSSIRFCNPNIHGIKQPCKQASNSLALTINFSAVDLENLYDSKELQEI